MWCNCPKTLISITMAAILILIFFNKIGRGYSAIQALFAFFSAGILYKINK